MTEQGGTEDVRLPDGTIGLVKDLVPGVRGVLRRGLSDEFQRACIRVGRFQKLIDPNPEVGFTDPLYDAGKLFHWAEPVGWAHAAPEVCRAEWRCDRTGWELDARHESPDADAEQRRTTLVALLRACLPRLVLTDSAADLCRPLPLAIAAAHVGLAALLKGATQRTARRFDLAHTLRSLIEYDRASASQLVTV